MFSQPYLLKRRMKLSRLVRKFCVLLKSMDILLLKNLPFMRKTKLIAVLETCLIGLLNIHVIDENFMYFLSFV